jgi:hypothetical protein
VSMVREGPNHPPSIFAWRDDWPDYARLHMTMGVSISHHSMHCSFFFVCAKNGMLLKAYMTFGSQEM